MPAAKPGDIWIVDLGMAAKVRPCLILTSQPRGDDLDVFTVVAHTTAIRGNQWEISIPKPFLNDDGAFDVQRIATVASVKLERKLGKLSRPEMDSILDRLAKRLGI
ncbi:MAG: type II toxin-antitoxin system PemK/MazF family toxin [Limisphaerales bacterium]